jgi:osmotically-inducible protein OsmY
MRNGYTRIALAAAVAALSLAACDRDDMQRADRAGAEVGRRADAAIAKTKGALVDAGHATKRTLGEAGQRIDYATSADRKPADAAANANANASADHADTGKQARAALGDAAITASIKAGFIADRDLSVLKIDVDTKDGVVTLNGLADTAEAKERATKIAQDTKGVREVRNHLTVKQG